MYLEVPRYLCTVHFAIYAVAVITLLLPAAAVWKLQSSVVASLPNTYDCRQTKTHVEPALSGYVVIKTMYDLNE